MITEIANVNINTGMESEFEIDVGNAVALISKARGFIFLSLRRNIEQSSLYPLIIEWDRLEDYTEAFRDTEGDQAWKALVGHCFASISKRLAIVGLIWIFMKRNGFCSRKFD